jgi:hypothetical protein
VAIVYVKNFSAEITSDSKHGVFSAGDVKKVYVCSEAIEDAVLLGASRCGQLGELVSDVVTAELVPSHMEYIYSVFLVAGRSLDFVCADLLYQKAKLLYFLKPSIYSGAAIEFVSLGLQYVQKSLQVSLSQTNDHNRLANRLHSLLLRQDLLTLLTYIVQDHCRHNESGSPDCISDIYVAKDIEKGRQEIFDECLVIADTHSLALLKLLIANKHEHLGDFELCSNMQLQAIEDMRKHVASGAVTNGNAKKHSLIRDILGKILTRLSGALPSLKRFHQLVVRQRKYSDNVSSEDSDS